MSKPTPLPVGSATFAGDLETNNGDMMIYNGQEWALVNLSNTDTEQFEQQSHKLHEKNPTLKTAWEEYKILRLLTVGDK